MNGKLERYKAKINRFKIYFGGSLCIRNHFSSGRYVSNNSCVECVKIDTEMVNLGRG